MQNLFSLRVKLFIIGTLVIISTAFVIFTIGYRVTRRTIIEEAKKRIISIVHERQNHLETWLLDRKIIAEEIASSYPIYSLLTQNTQTQSSISSVKKIERSMLFRNTHSDVSLYKAMLFSNQKKLVASTFPEDTALTDISFFEIQRALDGESFYGSIHLNSDQIPVINFDTHIHGPSGQIEGILYCEFLTSHTINPVLADTSGLGNSGEVFLVDSDTVMVTPSRFHNHPAHLTHKMPIPTVLAGLRKKSGAMVYKGFLGEQVVGAFSYMPAYGWVIVSEIRIEEAFKPLRKIITNTLFATILALIVLLVITSLLARAWTSPLEKLARASEKVGEGDLSVELEWTDRKDEIGVLIRMFNQMVHGISRSREELKTSHQRLLQSEKLAAIGRFVASIVHEMRNPLSAIKMNLRLLGRKTSQDSIENEHITIASEEVERLEKMFDDVLDYSKPPILNITPSDPIAIVHQSIKNSSPLAESSGISIELLNEIKDKDIEVSWDAEKIHQILNNVIQNAIQASDKNSSIKISAIHTNSDEILYIIVDQGCGMSESVQKRIFEPFYTSREDGVGLGMNNVKKFVEAHNGTIKIDSEVNVGTKISIILPVEINHG